MRDSLQNISMLINDSIIVTRNLKNHTRYKAFGSVLDPYVSALRLDDPTSYR